MATSTSDYWSPRQMARRALFRALLPVFLALAFVAAAVPISFIAAHSLDAVEAAHAQAGVVRVHHGLSAETARLQAGIDAFAGRGIHVNELVRALSAPGGARPALAGLALAGRKLLFLLRTDGSVLWRTAEPPAEVFPAGDWPAEHPLLAPAATSAGAGAGAGVQGLLHGAGAVVLVASRALSVADGGAPVIAVAGRRLDSALDGDLRARAGLAVELLPVSSPRYRTRFDSLDESQALVRAVTVRGSPGWFRAAVAARLVPDLSGRPALLIAARSSGETARAGRSAVRNIGAALFLVLTLALTSSAYLFTRAGRRSRLLGDRSLLESQERQASDPQALPRAKLRLVRRELRLAYRSSMVGAIVTPVPLMAIAALIHGRVAGDELAAWLVLAVSVACLRAAYAIARLRSPDFGHSPVAESRRAVLLAGLSGLSVGLGYLWFAAALAPHQEIMFIVVMGGLGVVAVVTLPTLAYALTAYVGGMLVPLCTVEFSRALVNEDPNSALLGFLFVVFAGLLVTAQRTFAGYVREGGRLRHVNEDLVAELRTAHAELRRSPDAPASESLTDALTGLANRSQFERRLESEWRRATRTGECVAVLFVDVDLFQEYVKTFGREQGDECLKRVAGALDGGVNRPGDLIARFESDVFALILAGTALEGAGAMANVMRERVLVAEIPHGASSVSHQVTVSAGVAALVPASGQSAALLTRCAGLALDEAKSLGRDRAVLATSETVRAASRLPSELAAFDVYLG